MRFAIIRVLVTKEIRRHLANRGGLAVALLLLIAALLLSVLQPAGLENSRNGGVELVGGVHHCYVDYTANTEFVELLRERVGEDQKGIIVFRERPPQSVSQLVTETPGTGVIRIKETQSTGRLSREQSLLASDAATTEPDRWKIEFEVEHPPGDPAAMAPYERWVWRAVREVLHQRVGARLEQVGGVDLRNRLSLPPSDEDDLWAVRESFRSLSHEACRLYRQANPRELINRPLVPEVEIHRSGLGAKPLDLRSTIATAMVVFSLYFTCCYLLPTLNCEERERGVLLAQALSPASPVEIVAAKFFFYPVAGIGLAAMLTWISNRGVLDTLFFWLAILATSCGFLGIGMTISTLARTQRGAFMGSMCYLLSVSLILFICSHIQIPVVPHLAIEFHGPKIIHAAMTGNVESTHWKFNLIPAFVLGMGWICLAGCLFRRRGWQ